MPSIRSPAVAGTFYPNDRQKLITMVNGFLADCRTDQAAPKAIIAPHAGYIYSGPIAASAYARVANGRKSQRQVRLAPRIPPMVVLNDDPNGRPP